MLVWRLTLYQKRGGNALFAATSRRIKVFEQKTGGVFDTTDHIERGMSMEKGIRKAVRVVMIFAMMAVMMSIPTMAEKVNIMLNPGKKAVVKGVLWTCDEDYVDSNSVKAKSSKPSVLSVSVKWNSKDECSEVHYVAKKAGSAKVTVSYLDDIDEVKLTFSVKVYKYVNPIKSVKIGGVTIKGKVFNKKTTYKLKYKKVKNKKAALKIKLKKGWQAAYGTPIYYSKENKFLAWPNQLSKKGKNGFVLKGGKGSYIAIACLHSPRAYDKSFKIFFS